MIKRKILFVATAMMAVISLGYRADEPNRPERKPLDDIVKFF